MRLQLVLGFRHIQLYLREDIDLALRMLKFQHLIRAFEDYEELVSLIEVLWAKTTIEELTEITVDQTCPVHLAHVLRPVLAFLDRDHALRRRLHRLLTLSRLHGELILITKSTGLYLYS